MGFLSKVIYCVWALLFENEVLYYEPRVKEASTDHTTSTVQNMTQPLSFEQKLDYFRQQMMLKTGANRKILKYLIRRNHLLEDAFRLVMNTSKEDLQSRLLISWEGEEGVDRGGLAKEFFCILSRELFDCKYGLFEMLTSNNARAIHVSPLAVMAFPDSSTWFHFSGRILGLALLNNHLLDVRLAPSLCKLLLRAPICLEDIKSQDTQLYDSLCWLKDNNIGAGHTLALTFAVSEKFLDEVVERELVPNGREIQVTEQNKREFLRLMIRWGMRLDGVTGESLRALMCGFDEVIDWQYISMFEAHELSLLLSGSERSLDVNEWRQHTMYGGGYYDQHPIIMWFWLVVEHFTSEQKFRLLQFVTGSTQLPHGDFAGLNNRFSIFKYGKSNDLPRAHTCINRLYLPPYGGPNILRDKLLYAQQCNSFDMA